MLERVIVKMPLFLYQAYTLPNQIPIFYISSSSHDSDISSKNSGFK
jgi:hypothetical protein